MKSLTNRRNKNAVRGSNNQVVFYKIRCAATQLCSNLVEIRHKTSQKSSF